MPQPSQPSQQQPVARARESLAEREQQREQRAQRETAAQARPYKVFVKWIDGLSETLQVIRHMETEHSVTFYMDDRVEREIVVPYSNLKFFEVVKD